MAQSKGPNQTQASLPNTQTPMNQSKGPNPTQPSLPNSQTPMNLSKGPNPTQNQPQRPLNQSNQAIKNEAANSQASRNQPISSQSRPSELPSHNTQQTQNSQHSDDKNALSSKLKRLIEQLKSALGILLNNLKKLQILDLSRPTPQIILLLDNIDKPNDACLRITQLLQNGHIDSENFDRKITAFTRVSPKFKQVGDAFKKAGGVPVKVFTEILLLFIKVITEVIDSMDNIVIEDKIRAAKL